MKHFNHSLKSLLFLLLGASCWSVALAETRLYDIELLVFQNLVNSDRGEIWHGDTRDDMTSPAEAAAAIDESAVSWLAAAQYRLNPEQASLRASAQYRPIAHLAWRQAVQGRKYARPVALPVSYAYIGSAFVDGTVTVAVERYLHLSLDLALHDDNGWPEQVSPRFRLAEQRRMRSGELHYFDHPRFGVLALITPYEAGQKQSD